MNHSSGAPNEPQLPRLTRSRRKNFYAGLVGKERSRGNNRVTFVPTSSAPQHDMFVLVNMFDQSIEFTRDNLRKNSYWSSNVFGLTKRDFINLSERLMISGGKAPRED